MSEEVVDPALVAPPIEEPEPVASVDPPANPDPAPQDAPRKDHWALRRISEESEKARQAQEALRDAQRRLSEAEAALARQSAGKDPPAPTPVPQADRKAEVRAEAARQRYLEDIGEVRSKAIQQFGASGFRDMLDSLNATGVNDEFLADVLAIDKANAHVILDEIAKNPEQAVNLAGMTSRQRIAELAKMNAKPAAAPTAPAASALAPARKVSAAPAPAPKVTPSAAPSAKDGYADDASDAEFDKQFNERWDKRRARR